MMKTDHVRVRHIVDAANKAIAFTQNRERGDLDRDEMLALATVRLIEIIGEAAKNVSEATRDRVPEVPWREITGMRDRLAHAYFNVNLDVVWAVVREDLPVLLPQLEGLLEEFDQPSD
jgi:uncharacterized protein with HEPN domain